MYFNFLNGSNNTMVKKFIRSVSFKQLSIYLHATSAIVDLPIKHVRGPE